MLYFIIVLLIIIVWSLIIVISKNKNTAPQSHTKTVVRPVIKLLNRDGDPQEDEWHSYIAGLNHHASKYDVGGFSGWVEADQKNSFDNKAMGIYNGFGKLLGYIPANELSDYRVWSNVEPQPCVGFIFIEDGQMRGRVKILHPCNAEFLETEFSHYLQWVNDNYGKEYLPKSLSMQFDIES